jgi:hypothetical protein
VKNRFQNLPFKCNLQRYSTVQSVFVYKVDPVRNLLYVKGRGLGCRVYGFGGRGLGAGVRGQGLGVWGSGFGVQGLGFRV